MNLEADVPGDEVVEYLRDHGAARTDADPEFPGVGRHQDNVHTYVMLMESGRWWESTRPIYLDAKTGTVWKGTDRTAAIARVDWEDVRARGVAVPSFHVIVEHAERASGDAPA